MDKTIPVAGVAVENVTFGFDKEYSYFVPESLTETLTVGCRVMVPFGRGSVKRQGIVLSLSQNSENTKLKYILEQLEEVPALDESMIELAQWMKERTFCTVFEAVKTMLPAGLSYKTDVSYCADSDFDVSCLTSDEKTVYDYFSSKKTFVIKSVALSDLNFNDSTKLIDSLTEKKALIRNYEARRFVGDASIKAAELSFDTSSADEILPSLTKKQADVVSTLLEGGSMTLKELCCYSGVTPAVVKALEKKNLVRLFDKEVYRKPYITEISDTDEIVLTTEQSNAYSSISNQMKNGGVSLLYGITGSGKTKIFLKLIDDMIESGLGIIVMVPEISLTPQTVSLFGKRYGDALAVFHSGLSLGERLDEYKRVVNNEAKIVIGTRSAVFAPFKKIGLIIMDEEQEHTYKSESSPRYHARDIAKYRCEKSKGLLLLASATPSIESYALAVNGTYTLNALNERYGSAMLPEVETIDMTNERLSGNTSQISGRLVSLLSENLKNHHQSILLINRRGYNTFVSCDSCKEVVTCPNCSISMTYHKAGNRLMCHYCGYTMPYTDVCPSCHEKTLRYSGLGTQKTEDEIADLFPDARILRMDADSTMAKYSYDEKLNAFGNFEYDIMLGTQMVAKGLDFQNVTLVGVLCADSSLYDDDYMSMERTFDLLTQVVGRSGRGEYAGKAVIQTLNTGNEIIQYAAKQDYNGFYEREIKMRKSLIYPPYCNICVIGFSSKNEIKVKNSAFEFLNRIKKETEDNYSDQKLIVLGPMPDRVYKTGGKYRYRIIIKCKNNQRFRKMISGLLKNASSDKAFSGVTVYADTEA